MTVTASGSRSLSASVDFVLLGLPRSGTTWAANWLTTDRSLCLHDPFQQLPERWQRDHRRFGVSCTGSFHWLPKWLAGQRCPVAVIERDASACDASLAAMGLPPTDEMGASLAAVQGRRLAFDDLWNEASAKALWKYLLPGIAFDPLLYRLLRDMRIASKTWAADTNTLAELTRRYG